MRVAPLDEALTELNVFSEKCRASGVQLDELMTLQYYATTTFAPEVEPYIDEHKQQWISGEAICAEPKPTWELVTRG